MNVRSFLRGSALAALVVGHASAVLADEWSNSFALALGTKDLGSGDWERADEQDAIGLYMDFRRNSWPVSIAVDILASGIDKGGNSNGYEGYTSELHLGARRAFNLGGSGLEAYLGGGIAFAYGEIELSDPERSGDGRGLGYWAGAGLRYPLTPRFSLGADYRYSDVDIDESPRDFSAGGRLFSLTASYRF